MCTYLSWTFFRGCCSRKTRSRTCGSENLFCGSPPPPHNQLKAQKAPFNRSQVCACRVQVKTVIGQGVCIAHRIVGISQLNLISLSSTPKNGTMMYHFSRLISGFFLRVEILGSQVSYSRRKSCFKYFWGFWRIFFLESYKFGTW